ncbi:MAG TPA: DUF4397 domain-containing protein, partial [Casimicrobiaceae bacterium]|nr:DUF4397 domain-containing protein [Casimicrobiaceae bacterium]
MRMHRVLLGAFWLTLAVVGLTGCNTGKGVVDPAVQHATLRIANLIPDASGPLNVTLDSNTFVSGLNFEALTQYQQIDSGSRVIQLSVAGGANNIISTTLNFTGTINYTLVAYGPVAEPTVVLIGDVTIDPGAGHFNLRLINAAAAGVSAVDIYVTAPGANLDATAPSIAGVRLGAASGFVTLPAGNVEIRITPANTKEVIY